jgi:TonB family protein
VLSSAGVSPYGETAKDENNRYGARELKGCYRRYVKRGMSLSFLMHGLLLSVYWLTQISFFPHSESGRVFIVRYADLGPPPSLQHELLHGIPSAKYSFKDFNYGLPVPVPEVELKEDKPFPTQDQLSQTGLVASEGNGGGIMIPDSVGDDLLGGDLEGIAPDVYPVLMKISVPSYPEAAMKRKLGGTVWLNVLVDQRGTVKSARVLKSDAEELNQAAIDAARKYAFTPGMYRNKPIPVWVSIPIEFRLEGN